MKLTGLNKEQKAAVEYTSGPQLVISGPGSGKTRVITYKIAYLIDKGLEPGSILALTFTNKAANEMKARIKELAGTRADQLWMGTFHSIFARILRIEAENLEFTSHFTIYDTDDSTALVSNIFQYDGLSMDNVTPNAVRKRISFLKNQMIFPENCEISPDNSTFDESFKKVYERYQEKLKENDAMDFDDLLLYPLELFRSRKILNKYKKRFQYILVDEFQDTNRAQYKLVKMLSGNENKVCAVGDDSQSIYSWRGADLSNMSSFSKDFRKTKKFFLEQSYRSTKTILEAANQVINNNEEKIEKKLWTENGDGTKISLLKSSDEKDEAFQISHFIKQQTHKNKLSLKDFAVFYRTNAQSRAMEDIFTTEKIPYVVIGGLEFYKRKEVKDILAYLRVLVNQNDEESLLRIMNFPQRGIGMTTVKRMLAFARRHEVSVFETMTRVFEVIDIKERIQKNVKNFKMLLDKYIGLKSKLSLGELTRALIDELGLIKLYREEHSLESLSRLENVEQLLSAISQFSDENPDATLEDYLETVALITDLDLVDGEKNAVSLMTVHSAKGLEFPVVFVSGLEEDIFPLSNKFSQEASLEEERRLFYVAVTRAQRQVYLSHARSRYRFGEVAYQSRSRFIDEIDEKLLQEEDASGAKKASRKTKKEMYYEYFENVDYADPTSGNNTMKVGSRVMHEKFGLGKVIQLVGSGEHQKATVVFEGNNIKQLMLKFAKLKVLN